MFYKIYCWWKGICPKCGRVLGVWRDGCSICYHCDLYKPK